MLDKNRLVTHTRQDGDSFDFGGSFHTLYTRFLCNMYLQVMYVMSEQLSLVEEALAPYLFKSLDLAVDQYSKVMVEMYPACARRVKPVGYGLGRQVQQVGPNLEQA
jgi:hypothetical protein